MFVSGTEIIAWTERKRDRGPKQRKLKQQKS